MQEQVPEFNATLGSMKRSQSSQAVGTAGTTAPSSTDQVSASSSSAPPDSPALMQTSGKQALLSVSSLTIQPEPINPSTRTAQRPVPVKVHPQPHLPHHEHGSSIAAIKRTYNLPGSTSAPNSSRCQEHISSLGPSRLSTDRPEPHSAHNISALRQGGGSSFPGYRKSLTADMSLITGDNDSSSDECEESTKQITAVSGFKRSNHQRHSSWAFNNSAPGKSVLSSPVPSEPTTPRSAGSHEEGHQVRMHGAHAA